MNPPIKAGVPDALAGVLSAIELSGQVFWYNQLKSPWGLRLPPGEFGFFHVIERGSGCVRLKGERAAQPLTSGDLVIIPHGNGHVIADSPGTAPQSLENFIRLAARCTFEEENQDAAATHLICGKFQFENMALNPLLPLLPPLIYIRGQRGQADEWLASTLRLLAYEARAPRPGAEEIIARLTGIIFIQAMRAWLGAQPEAQGGWFGALRDPQIGAALSAIHRAPERAWSVTMLAKRAGMSRSNFAARFTALVGVSPLKYLNHWRLHLAAGFLRRDRLRISEVAARIGYESETSFSKAFKRRFAVAPGSYRRAGATEAESLAWRSESAGVAR